MPRHITLDTTVLVHLLFTEEHRAEGEDADEGGAGAQQGQDLGACSFRTDHESVRDARDYRFNNMVYTDGVSCSVLLIRRDLYGKKCSKGQTGGGGEREVRR